MKKKWWRNWIVIISLIAAVLTITNSFYGWLTPKEKPGFICPDGTIVSEPEKCPICNEDGTCQEKESCDCIDCKTQIECLIQRIGNEKYLLMLDDRKRIEGEYIIIREITKEGSVTVEVSGVLWEIPSTKQEEIIDGLKVTTQEIIYNYLRPQSSMVIAKIEKYEPEENEYLFNVNEYKIIENTKLRLNKVSVSKPYYILLDVGDELDEKIEEGREARIKGFKIELIKTYPREKSSESYAVIKIEKAQTQNL